jgi:putative tricarboxylic transport membrane protein
VVLTDLPMRNAGKCGWANSGLRDSDLVVGLHPKAADFCRSGAVRARRSRSWLNLPRLLPVAHWNVLRIMLCEPKGRFGARTVRGIAGGNMSEGVSPSPRGTRPGFSIHTHNLLGGLTVTVLALVLLGFAFYVPNTVIPRFILAGLVLIGIAAAVGILPVHAPRDFYGGIALVILPAFALVASAELPGQRGFAFGPGTAPRLFSFVLAALGAAVAIGGVFAEGPPIEKYKIRGPTLVIIAILSFAAMIRPLGLVPATFLAFMISILGSTEMRWIESTIAAALMTLFCVLLFVYLLNLPFQLWPRFY